MTISKDRKCSKVLVSMPAEFLKALDERAESECRSRSEMIREAVRQYIKGYTR
jgi:metal-responsive CopG/Arc/MetJ family transcriptional regulator